jgi:hypothetical protein
MEVLCSSETLSFFFELHVITTDKSVLFIVTSVRNSHATKYLFFVRGMNLSVLKVTAGVRRYHEVAVLT